MNPPGPLLAQGRDADVFEYGDGKVLRRSREGRSLIPESRTLSYLHAHGYPVPRVDEVSDDGRDLVMERVDGPTMVDAIARRPWTLRRSARLLADLHDRLHELDAPDFLAPARIGTGSKVVHLDLHPLNVLMSRTGPVVIDWTGAGAGDPDVDVAVAWVLMAAGELPRANRVRTAALGVSRRLLVSTFVSCFERGPILERLRDVVAWKVKDPHMSPSEVETMWALLARAEAHR
ncbi:MAG TPA: phosphotransferase [Acidimicrobiales bacterium]|nr:phosphotransferase [Acidimicrobiales bacterium]